MIYVGFRSLKRYSQFTGDQKYLDDAANQFFGFRETFVYAGRKIMVTLFMTLNMIQSTNVPWGRGNGWVVFSMTEFAEVLLRDHPKRNGLIDSNTLCEGYLALQDDEECGTRYLTTTNHILETSCTSIYICVLKRYSLRLAKES